MAAGDLQAWTALAFSGRWGNYGGSWTLGEYMKDASGFVTLHGLVANPNDQYAFNGANSIIATLPTGFRPSRGTLDEMFIQVASDTSNLTYWARVDVKAAGSIQIVAGMGNSGLTSYFNLSGIRFYAGF